MTELLTRPAQRPVDILKRDASAQSVAMLQLVCRVIGKSDLSEALQFLADGVHSLFPCQCVAIAVTCGGRARLELAAVANASTIDRRSEFAHALEDALREAAMLDRTVVWPPADEPTGTGSLTHKVLSTLAAVPAVLSAPLKTDDGRLVGAWLFMGDTQQIDRIRQPPGLSEVALPAAAAINAWNAARRPRVFRAFERVIAWVRTRRFVMFLGGLGILAAVAMVPVEYRLRCRCRIEPVVRRYVAAPFAGPLKESRVRPGDAVKVGDVLAVMEGREMRFELAALQARLEQAQQRLDGAIAKHNAGTVQLEQMTARELEMEIRTLADRIEHLEIRSPLDGVVVSGDLRRAQGSPLTVGQNLFEVAPLDQLIAEVSIPESEIAYVREGMPVLVQLEAGNFEDMRGTLSKLHPRAEPRDGATIFVAEVSLAKSDERLLPGMNGRAYVDVGRKTLGWNLMHRPFETFRRLIGF